jgi:hypothetical protein
VQKIRLGQANTIQRERALGSRAREMWSTAAQHSFLLGTATELHFSRKLHCHCFLLNFLRNWGAGLWNEKYWAPCTEAGRKCLGSQAGEIGHVYPPVPEGHQYGMQLIDHIFFRVGTQKGQTYTCQGLTSPAGDQPPADLTCAPLYVCSGRRVLATKEMATSEDCSSSKLKSSYSIHS